SHIFDAVARAAPLHPGRAPLLAWHPAPTELIVVRPAAVVIGDEAPARLGLVGLPVPAPVIGVGPAAVGVGPPVACTVSRNPHVAKARMVLPALVRLECGAEIGAQRGFRFDLRL